MSETSSATGTSLDENPFFQVWTTPFDLPPFDQISPGHFAPAFARALTELCKEYPNFAKQISQAVTVLPAAVLDCLVDA